MHFVLLSVMCSVAVAVVIKLARMKGVNHKQLIVWNYPVAVLCTYFVLKPDFSAIDLSTLPWGLYIPLGLLLPTIFICIALSVQYGGIVKTEVAQRLSLFIPLLAAFFLFEETIGPQKMVGIAIGLLSIIFSIGWHKSTASKSNVWIYPLVVFFGMGIIDVLFKKVALDQQVGYMASLWLIFLLAFMVILGFLAYWLLVAREQFDQRSIGWGMLLGALNFGNILFYMRAHRALPDNPSIVFTAMNIGVIVVGALVGVFFFSERLSIWNKAGVVLAILSVLFIAYL